MIKHLTQIQAEPLEGVLKHVRLDHARFRDTPPVAFPTPDFYARLHTQPYTRPIKKLGRNEPCRCGSGRKYKKCCIHLDELENHAVAVGLK